VNALVSGGYLPNSQRGKTITEWTAMEDLYTTYCGLAGVSVDDKKAEAAGLPKVDGVDLWPLLSGSNATGPRSEIWLGSGGAGDSDSSADPIVQAYIRSDGFKILYGNVIENTWSASSLYVPCAPAFISFSPRASNAHPTFRSPSIPPPFSRPILSQRHHKLVRLMPPRLRYSGQA